MEQEMLIIIIRKRDLYDPEHASGASIEQFLSFVLDKALLNLMEARNAMKRGNGIHPLSLDQEITDDEGDSCQLSETVSEADGLGGRRSCPLATADFSFDTERMFRRLNKEQREIGSLIIKGYTPSEISRLIKKPRTTLHTEIQRLGKLLMDDGLRDFLSNSHPEPEKFPAEPVEEK